MRRIVETAERETLALLRGERSRLDALAKALLEGETLDQEEAYAVAGVPVPERAPEPQLRSAAAAVDPEPSEGASGAPGDGSAGTPAESAAPGTS